MATFNDDHTCQNLKRLRLAAQLTQEELGTFLGVSGKTVQNVENDVEGTLDNNIDSFEKFFGVSKAELKKVTLKIPENYREQLQKRHAKNEEFYLKLNKVPTIPFALKTMIAEGELNTPKTIKQIREYFAKKNWRWANSSIPDAIKSNKEKLGIETGSIEGVKKGFYYWAKQDEGHYP